MSTPPKKEPIGKHFNNDQTRHRDHEAESNAEQDYVAYGGIQAMASPDMRTVHGQPVCTQSLGATAMTVATHPTLPGTVGSYVRQINNILEKIPEHLRGQVLSKISHQRSVEPNQPLSEGEEHLQAIASPDVRNVHQQPLWTQSHGENALTVATYPTLPGTVGSYVRQINSILEKIPEHLRGQALFNLSHQRSVEPNQPLSEEEEHKIEYQKLLLRIILTKNAAGMNIDEKVLEGLMDIFNSILRLRNV